MKTRIFFLISVCCSCLAMAQGEKQYEAVRVEATYCVMMDAQAEVRLKAMLEQQDGVVKYRIDRRKQVVSVSFLSDKNTVSNLLKQIRGLGYTATSLDTGCLGSKEGCLNALHPENTMP